jgi:hypothetical protein
MSNIEKLLAANWKQLAPHFRGLERMPNLTLPTPKAETVEIDITPVVVEAVVAALKHQQFTPPTPFVGVMPTAQA